MRSLFLKVFLWFWVATILSGLAFFIIGFATHYGRPPEFRGPAADQWRRLTGQTLALYGQTAVVVLERDGHAALEEYAALLERTTGTHVVLFLREKETVTDRGASPKARGLAARAAESGRAEVDFTGETPLLATRVLRGEANTLSSEHWRSRQVGQAIPHPRGKAVTNRLRPSGDCRAGSLPNSCALPVASACGRSLPLSWAAWCVSGWLGV